jgi:anti-sigma B factor antagonist
VASLSESEPLELAIRPDRARVIVALRGELDLASTETVRPVVEQLYADDWPGIVLDLRELTFIDSTGLSLLLDAERTARRRGATFAITNGSTDVERLLEIVGLADHFSRTRLP